MQTSTATSAARKRKLRKKKPKTLTWKGKLFQATLLLIALLAIGFTVYIVYRIQIAGEQLIPLSVIALIAGVVFENKKLMETWSTVLWTAVGSLFLSFLVFLRSKSELVYDFDNHIGMWPYAFIFFFTIISISLHEEKVTARLTEGITLLQSCAVLYWVWDYGLMDTDSSFLKVIMVAGIALSLFSFVHAFSQKTLSRTSRLTLSIWSSLIMALFAVDNIYRIYQNEQIEATTDPISGAYIALQYFLLGVSSIYIAQNIYMLISFLPGKHRFFNAEYFKDLKELKNAHIKRYSAAQVDIKHALFCFFFAVTAFASNHYFQLLPRHLAIWVVFLIFPYTLALYDYALRKTTTSA